jgi:hypothetical protein
MKKVFILLLVLLVAAVGYYLLDVRQPAQEDQKISAVLPEQPESPQPANDGVPAAAPPETRSGADQSVASEMGSEPLPDLANSDPMVLESLVALLGEDAVTRYVVSDHLVSRLVATINLLGGRQVSANLMPLHPMDTAFEANLDFDPPAVLENEQGDPLRQYLVDPVNFARYTPYVQLLESLDMNQVAAIYERQQPLFQQAYADLGYKDRDFTTRLLEVIDLMLDAPAPAEPLRLIKPEAYYRYADPELEALPAGQKLMIRMGSSNAERVKLKLQELREALAAAGLASASDTD